MINRIIIALGLSVLTVGCGKNESHPSDAMSDMPAGSNATNQHQSATKATLAEVYTCSMHPEVKADKPGNCPKCGMTLIKNGK